MKVFTVSSLLCAAAAMELTNTTWDDATVGRSVFIKFLDPSSGDCKRMKPAWDQLMDAFKYSKSTVVATVDCTGEGRHLCSINSITDYPTIRYGHPDKLAEYDDDAPRDFDSLKKFADENLGPSCSPWFIDLCDADKRKSIEQLQSMSSRELDAAIEGKLAEMQIPRAAFTKYMESWSKTYQERWKESRQGVEAATNSLRLMEKVQKYRISISNSEEL